MRRCHMSLCVARVGHHNSKEWVGHWILHLVVRTSSTNAWSSTSQQHRYYLYNSLYDPFHRLTISLSRRKINFMIRLITGDITRSSLQIVTKFFYYKRNQFITVQCACEYIYNEKLQHYNRGNQSRNFGDISKPEQPQLDSIYEPNILEKCDFYSVNVWQRRIDFLFKSENPIRHLSFSRTSLVTLN